jgi:hypothetical protein
MFRSDVFAKIDQTFEEFLDLQSEDKYIKSRTLQLGKYFEEQHIKAKKYISETSKEH